MTITYIGEDVDYRRATRNFKKATLNTEYVRRFKLKSDALSDTPFDVLANASIPAIWSQHPDDPTSIVEDYQVTLAPGATNLWFVDVNYMAVKGETLPDEQLDPLGDPNTDPVDLSPRLRWSYEMEDVIIKVDADGSTAKMKNSAGLPFHPPPKKRQPISVLTWTRWQWTFGGGAEQQAWIGAVNNADWAGAGAKQVMIAGIEAQQERIRGVLLWHVTDVLKFRPGGWALTVPDSSELVKDAGGNLIRPVEARGNPGKFWLNASGAYSTTPKFIDIDVYTAKDFASRYGG